MSTTVGQQTCLAQYEEHQHVTSSHINASPTRVMSPVWLGLWALLLAITWLVPNHFPPWSAFHADAWLAVVALMGSFAVALRTRGALPWTALSAGIGLLVFLPWFHFALGLLPFAGQAWMSSAYLLGLCLAVLTGARWEAASPRQLGHALFLAIGLAGALSVWLQLSTWLGVIDTGLTDIWSMGLSGDRPYGNLGQPNQLATLLLWGVLACLWAHNSGALGATGAVAAAMFLLVGVALTQSRTALLATTLILVAVWFWRRLWRAKRLPLAASALFGFYLLCPLVLRWINAALLLSPEGILARRLFQDDARLAAWKLFAHAAADRPWSGFGWTELGNAQLSVADRFPGLGVTFAHAHNLFLDLILWNGFPLGIILSVLLLAWFWRRVKAIQHPQDAVLLMLMAVIGVHATLELPLHYAYFLLPVGLVAGMLETRLGAKVCFTTPRWTLGLVATLAGLVLAVIIRDYLRVEASYNILRFEIARIGVGKQAPGEPPDVLMLTQQREWTRVARWDVKPDMSTEQLALMAQVTRTFPAAGTLYRYAKALALNQQPQEAALWLAKICKIADEQQCSRLQRAWSQESQAHPRLALVKWPGQ